MHFLNFISNFFIVFSNIKCTLTYLFPEKLTQRQLLFNFNKFCLRTTSMISNFLITRTFYFTPPKKLKLFNTFFYTRLWLSNLAVTYIEKIVKTKLFLASGAAPKLLDKNLSLRELHKKFHRATPTQFQKYTTAVFLYDLIKKEIPEEDWINLQFIIQNDRRNMRLCFNSNNRYKCGVDCLSNRFKSVTDEI